MNNAKASSAGFAAHILGRYLNVDGMKLKIGTDKYGKPFLKGYPHVHYNISHTKGAIICAVADMPVGVDIEAIRPLNQPIIERFFTPNEQNYILSNTASQDERYTEIWTRKEAYVKWLGKGIAIPFESFDVTKEDSSLIRGYRIKQYIIAVCGMSRAGDIRNLIEITDYCSK